MFVTRPKLVTSTRSVLVAALILAFCPLMSSVDAADSIKIGIIDDFSGRSTAVTSAALLGWKMVLEDFNAQGGLNGAKLEIITADDKFNAKNASELAEKLISEDKVHFLGGSSSSSCAHAISEIARKHKTIFMIHVAKDSSITADKGHDYVFRSCVNTEIEGKTGGKYAAYKKYAKWFIIGEDYDYSRSLVSSFWDAISKWNPNAEKIGEAWVKLKTEDYSSYLRQISDAHPTAVFAAFGASGRVAFIKQGQKAGLFENTRVFMTELADSSMPEQLQDAMPDRNAYGSAQYLYYFPKTPNNEKFSASYTAFAKAQGAKDPKPSYGAYGGYCAAKFLVQALVKAGTPDTEKVIAALKGSTIDTPVGPVTMRPCDHQAMVPLIWGSLGRVDGFSAPVLFQPFVVNAEDVVRSCEEVLKLRR